MQNMHDKGWQSVKLGHSELLIPTESATKEGLISRKFQNGAQRQKWSYGLLK